MTTSARSRRFRPHPLPGRRGGFLPRPRRAQLQICTTDGDLAKCPVGADDHIGPHAAPSFLRNPSTNPMVPYGRGRTPPLRAFWGILRVCIGAYETGRFLCRADVVIGPYGCVRVRIGSYDFVTSYRREGQAPPLRYDEIWEASADPVKYPNSPHISHFPR